ncbi:variable surface lipoprotein [Mycoplasmopsis felis]|uniref:variable surface lipoprotein n=1 Tax=Mycoplasmopsis felis TaxID=33923 RepID=UPI002AFFD9D1|nr:variable surface lipoprotein [Mycoplasmopsis felis]WQQ05918.1 variable surface lipoprotein [Mycoplasmopsis felis]
MKKYKKLLISMSLISTIAIPTISMSCTNQEKKSNKDKSWVSELIKIKRRITLWNREIRLFIYLIYYV